MAKAAGVRVVPVSIGNLHRLMPSSAALPLAPLRYCNNVLTGQRTTVYYIAVPYAAVHYANE